MGGFVSVALAHLAPERVSRLVLVDGGLPLDAPAGLSPEQLVAAILGPTAERLSMRFATVAEYFDFWRGHPAFAGAWSPELETYLAYDLVPAGRALRPATSLETVTEDTIDMNSGPALPDALAALDGPAAGGPPVLFVSVPRGLRDETPGLYPRAHLERMLAARPSVRHVRLDGLNHYTVVLAAEGAAALGAVLRAELG
jgi:pimeloyl-ACP methyl ester carboxylesterase